jgi:hypothetical protein
VDGDVWRSKGANDGPIGRPSAILGRWQRACATWWVYLILVAAFAALCAGNVGSDVVGVVVYGLLAIGLLGLSLFLRRRDRKVNGSPASE